MSNRGNSSRRAKLKRQLQQVEHECWLCGFPLDNDAPYWDDLATEVDEETPTSLGGDVYGVRTPCHLVHRICNNKKSNSELEQYALRDWFISHTKRQEQAKAKPSRKWL